MRKAQGGMYLMAIGVIVLAGVVAMNAMGLFGTGQVTPTTATDGAAPGVVTCDSTTTPNLFYVIKHAGEGNYNVEHT